MKAGRMTGQSDPVAKENWSNERLGFHKMAVLKVFRSHKLRIFTVMGYIKDLRKILGTRPLIMTGSCVLVFNEDGQLLLQKRSDTLDWGTIGGSMELGESLEGTAMRELYEEAGLTAESLRFVTVLSGPEFYYKYPHGDEVHSVVAVYEAIGIQGIPTTLHDDEGLELRYFSLQEPLPELNPFTGLLLRKLGYC